MQTSKTRAGTLEVPQRTSRKLKATGSDPDNASSQSPVARTSVERSPKVDRRSPRTPTSEKKRPGRVSELETQVAQLEEELKKVKDQLSQSESSKKQAHQEADEAKKQLAAMSAKLDELSASEDSRVQELRKISQERDRAWQSELEAVQKHHSMDSAALASAMNEIQKLKIQLEKVAESETTQAKHAESAHNEIATIKLELSESLALVQELKTQLNDCKESETRASEILRQTREQLEMVKSTEETLRSEKLDAMKAYDSLAMELENSQIQSTLQIRSAYELVEQTKAELEELKAKLVEKEARLQNLSDENKELNEKVLKTELKEEKDPENGRKLKRLEVDLEEMKRVVFDKETELKNMAEAERDESSRRVARVTDQLEAAQAANAEMEAELRRLKVQLDQWRKAAEVAAAMLSGGNGKYVERTGSLDSHTLDGKLNLPYSDEMEDESPKKRNGNMLKKIGGLLKKGQK